MIYKIQHKTYYKYDEAVFLEPHHLYLIPQQRLYQKVLELDIDISPSPAGQTHRIDMENNPFIQCWFNETLDELKIESRMLISCDEYNIFDTLIEERNYPTKASGPYLQIDKPLNSNVINWLDNIKNDDIIGYLNDLCHAMNKKWGHTTSYDPVLMDPEVCFDENSASCRDLSWLMMQLLRHKHIPTRFVSGYAFNPEITGHELHAWVEAFISGPGWIGLDPTAGIFTTESYIPLATSFHPRYTLPVQGNYRGSSPSSLYTDVIITAEE